MTTSEALLMPANTNPADRLLVGNAVLLRALYNEQTITELWNSLVNRYSADCTDFDALLDLSVLVHATGQPQKGREMQLGALQFKKIYKRIHGRGQGLRVLALVVEGDLTANTPIDFILERSDMTLYTAYVDATTATLAELPDADVVFVAIGESPANQAVLKHLQFLLQTWNPHAPIVNHDVALIARMTRDQLHLELSDEPSILSPPQVKVGRAELEAIVAGSRTIADVLPGYGTPVLLRPVGTHAGNGFERIATVAALADYLSRTDVSIFYMSPFIDYQSPDGLYRKQRVVFIKGKPFACHMAISSHWMVHYLSAEMDKYPERREEEKNWMLDFHSKFAKQYEVALKAIYKVYPLDYFAVDCIPFSDGRLLVFEADNIMIVHDLDDHPMFAYKKPVMHELFAAFQEMLTQASGKIPCHVHGA